VGTSAAGDKAALRRAALARRAAGPPGPGCAAALAQAIAPLTRGASRIAAYSSFGAEPPTGTLLDSVEAEVLLPVLLPDGDLDWTARAAGPALGPDAVASCELVVVPALAVDRRGVRLGRGGGSYDRALARVPSDVLTVALLLDDELVELLPSEPHDVRVRAVASPSGGLQLL
jgi:5-formyltetrahydrofolate cyclo-ligase